MNYKIELFNINTEGVNFKNQCLKVYEEYEELREALEYNSEYKERESISEFWDVVQALISLMEKRGITAVKIQNGYKKHFEKMAIREFKARELKDK